MLGIFEMFVEINLCENFVHKKIHIKTNNYRLFRKNMLEYVYQNEYWRSTMSVGATRKVTSSLPRQTAERTYDLANSGEAFVENIDTNNNVSVDDGLTDRSSQKFSRNKKEKDEKRETKISPSSAYVASAIEALAASGVFEDDETDDKFNNHVHKIGVYGNNQSIVRDEDADRIGHQYLKHFYEKNEVLEEVDELI